MSCGLSFGLSPCELSCTCLDWRLVHGISLPAAQLFVIAIENILPGEDGGGGGCNKGHTVSDNCSSRMCYRGVPLSL